MCPTAVGAWTRLVRVPRCRPGHPDGNSKGGKAREEAAVAAVDGTVAVGVAIEVVGVGRVGEMEGIKEVEVGVAVVAEVVEDTKENLADVEIDDSGKSLSRSNTTMC